MSTAEQVAACIKNNQLRIKAKPGARETKILKIENNVVHIAIAAQPEDGKANHELERFLTKLLKRKAVMKSGFSSREKVVVFS
jgi:uncharacterized protein